MGGLTPSPLAREERDFSRWTILIAVAVVLVLMVGIALLLREEPKKTASPPAYVANLKLGDFKMSAAENFAGATVSYIDGSIANIGSQTVTRVIVEVTFKDDMAQVAQREQVPLRILRTEGPYPEAIELKTAPLPPGQTQPFRLTFDSISAQWNRQYPEIRVTDVTVK